MPFSGGANYTAIAPPHSYIDVNDFASPKDLAEYILHLDKTPEEYLAYFWWRPYYRVSLDVSGMISVHNHATFQAFFRSFIGGHVP